MKGNFSTTKRMLSQLSAGNDVLSSLKAEKDLQVVTPEMARDILENCEYEHQRNVRQSHVDYLAKQMKAGKFLPTSTITLYNYCGQQVLVDGQHRLWAVALTGEQQVMWVQVLTGDIEIAKVYTVFDDGAQRTMMDRVNALGVFEGVDLGVLRKPTATAASRVLNHESSRSSKDAPDEMVMYINEWLPYIGEYGNLIRGGRLTQPLRNTAYVVAGAVTLRACPDKAREFWPAVAQDDGLGRYDPRKRLIVLIDESLRTREKRGGTGYVKTTIALIAYFWNKHFEGATVARLPATWPTPAKFSGSDWVMDGKKGGE